MRNRTVFFTSYSFAGANHFAQASLSWSATERLVTASTQGTSGPFPVYVLLEGATDIQRLDIHLAWAPFQTQVGALALVNPPESLLTTCAYAAVEEQGAGSDTTGQAQATVVIPPGAAKDVVAFWFNRADLGGNQLSSAFRLLSAKVTDSAGQVDSLPLLEWLRIGNGMPMTAPTSALGIARGKVLLRFGLSTPTQYGLHGRVTPEQVLGSGATASAIAAAGIEQLQSLCPWCRPEDVNSTNFIGEPITLPDATKWFIGWTSPEALIMKVASDVEALPEIDVAEPVGEAQFALIPSDTMFYRQWALRNANQDYGVPLLQSVPGADIRVERAYDRLSNPGLGVRVGIMDTGVDAEHPEFGGRVEPGFNATQYLQGRFSFTADTNSHGTAVAGIVGASGNNVQGMSGIAWNCSIVPIKVDPEYWGEGYNCAGNKPILLDAAACGSYWADSVGGIPIINMSFGGGAYRAFADALLRGFLRGRFNVAATGNWNTNNPDDWSYPAAYNKRVFGVGAVTWNGLRWDDSNGPAPPRGWQRATPSLDPLGSNWGPMVAAVAPGGHLIVSLRNYVYADWYLGGPCAHTYFPVYDLGNGISAPYDTVEFGGTSAASPMVAGVAALLLGEYPEMLGEDVWQVLVRTATAPNSGQQGLPRTDSLGAGLVRADQALDFAKPPLVISHQRATALATVSVDRTMLTFINDDPKVQDGTYSVLRHRLRGSAAFPHPFDHPPAPEKVWVRASGTNGSYDTDTLDYIQDVPGGTVVGATTDSITAETFVYELLNPDDTFLAWYPVDPQSAAIATTAIGPIGDQTGVEGPSRPELAVRVRPNPARGRTVVNFVTPEAGSVRVEVYDVQGRRVRQLGAGVVPLGGREYVWDGRDGHGERVKAGLYWVRGSFRERTVVARCIYLGPER